MELNHRLMRGQLQLLIGRQEGIGGVLAPGRAGCAGRALARRTWRIVLSVL